MKLAENDLYGKFSVCSKYHISMKQLDLEKPFSKNTPIIF